MKGARRHANRMICETLDALRVLLAPRTRLLGLDVGAKTVGLALSDVTLTVATPYMLKLIKIRYPRLKVRVSVFSGVDRVRKAQMWEEMGADCIVLDSILVNRELKTLSR